MTSISKSDRILRYFWMAISLFIVAVICMTLTILDGPSHVQAQVPCSSITEGPLEDYYKDGDNWVKAYFFKEFVIVQQPGSTSSIYSTGVAGVKLEREGRRLCFMKQDGRVYAWDIPAGRPWLVLRSHDELEPIATSTFDPGSGCQAPDCIGGGGTDVPTATPTFDPASGCDGSGCIGGGGTDTPYPTYTPVPPTIVPTKG